MPFFLSKKLSKLKVVKNTTSGGCIVSEGASSDKMVMTISECRIILDDYKSSDEVIQKRLEYLTAMCRNLIRHELKTGKKYEQSKKD